MSRQTATGRVVPAGSSRGERLDPFAFPLRFEVADDPAEQRAGSVELDAARVLLRCAVRGANTLVLPLTTYHGVAIRMDPPAGTTAGAVAVVLEHPDPALSLTLYRSVHGSDVVAEWRAWARALGVPLLVTEADGRLREPFARIGAMRIGHSAMQRRRRSSRRARRTRRGVTAVVRGFGSAPRARPWSAAWR